MTIRILIQNNDFNQGEEYSRLAKGSNSGAIVTFVGRVREFSSAPDSVMWLEHYPSMTEKSLRNIIERAKDRWPIESASVVHRVGQLSTEEQIVFVGVASAHRSEAFDACQFIMDYLKTEAPFWKKEGHHWVEAKDSDKQKRDKWEATEPHEPLDRH